MIYRHLHLDQLLQPNKVIVLYGPRQAGKTTLVKEFLSRTSLRYKFENGDDLRVREAIGSQSIATIQKYVEGYELLVVDEAQRIPDVGLGLKILVDNVPGIRVIVTGSASFALSYKIGEPLVGRAYTHILYPISQLELKHDATPYELMTRQEEHLIYGSYPSVLTAETNIQKAEYLKNVVGSFLLKDILEIEKVKNAKVLFDLLKLIAFQVGSEVSLTELGGALSLDRKTVARLLYLLEQAFILVNLRGYSRNLRSEVTKKSKYYFLDTGIRNAVISNFNGISDRDDLGKLWENFLVTERLKYQQYTPLYSSNYFWRTWDQKEIDWVEERDGGVFGWEFKYSPKKKSSGPLLFKKTYPKAEIHTVNTENYLDFIT
jgi:predicted AAA+ superfamily ATPase